MSFVPFENLCNYYLDYLIEDSTDSVSAFASGKNLSYMQLDNPEFSSRDNIALNHNETNEFRNLSQRQTRGQQRKTWWYGYPTAIKFITGRNNWRGGMIKPLFIVPLQINSGVVSLMPANARLNNSAFRDLGLELTEIRSLGENLGLYEESTDNYNLSSITEKLIKAFPDINLLDLNNISHFSNLPFIQETNIYKSGIILSAEASNYTQGLEKELSDLRSKSQSQIVNSSLKTLFPDLVLPAPKTTQRSDAKTPEYELSEAIELNEQQRETVLSAFKNNLTVVTGPPGTGKSQVVASIVINAAKNGQRVLVASKNHKAVDVVEERLNQFAARPFILRLGKSGGENRNFQQQLVDYLNSLLGSAPNVQTNQKLKETQSQLSHLYQQRNNILGKIENYRKYRNDLFTCSKEWQSLQDRIGEEKSEIILSKCKAEEFGFFDKIKLLLSKDWKLVKEYSRLLKSVSNEESLEELSLTLAQLELQIRVKSKDEFVLWLNDLPSRLSSNQRQTIAQFVTVLQQLTQGDDNTPRNVWARLFQQRDALMSSLSGFLPAWCVVNLSVKGQVPLIDSFYDIVIIDEASQCDIASALPLLFRAKRVVIIGDPNQLTHISTLTTGRSLALMHSHNLTDIKYSVFEATINSLYRLAAARIGDNKIIMLNEHFRSHKDIISYSNSTWYSGNLSIGTDYDKLNPQLTPDQSVIEWVNVEGSIQQVDGSGAFINNEMNAVVEKVIEIVTNNHNGIEIGIVTPFRLQANKIRQALIQRLDPSIWNRTNLLVDTAVKFQGDERDVMIFSPVVTRNMPSGIKYYHQSTSNLVNVAITRARAKLYVIGNLDACRSCGIKYIQDFANYVINLSAVEDKKLDSGGAFESPYEEILYKALKVRKIITMPQYTFDQYRLDLAYVSDKINLDIEIDGVAYHTDWTGERLKQDLIRNYKLQKKGWTILRFWSYELRDNLDYCVSKIIQTINKAH
jgi:very-short-patch-repair endonuclease